MYGRASAGTFSKNGYFFELSRQNLSSELKFRIRIPNLTIRFGRVKTCVKFSKYSQFKKSKFDQNFSRNWSRFSKSQPTRMIELILYFGVASFIVYCFNIARSNIPLVPAIIRHNGKEEKVNYWIHSTSPYLAHSFCALSMLNLMLSADSSNRFYRQTLLQLTISAVGLHFRSRGALFTWKEMLLCTGSGLVNMIWTGLFLLPYFNKA